MRVFQNSQLNNEQPDYGNNSLQMYPFIHLFLSLDVVQNDPILVLWFYLNFTWSTKCCPGEKLDTKKVKGTTECKDQNFLISFSFPFHNTFNVYLTLNSTSAMTGSFTGTENCYCILNLWPSHGQNVQASVCLGKKE